MRTTSTDCPNCQSKGLEIKLHGYPREIFEPYFSKTFYEHRYVCCNCGFEWVYDNLFKIICPVPIESPFRFDKTGHEIVSNQIGSNNQQMQTLSRVK